MHRRKYLAAIGLAAGAGLAGCSGETGSNNSSSGGNSSGGGGGSEETEASGGSESTEASGGSEETEMSTSGEEDSESDSTSTSGEEDDEESSDSTATSESEDSGSDSDSDSEESSSIEDSGDTDVSVKSTDIADAFTVESVEYYNEDMSNGVRGEVTNTSDSSISYVEISAYLYDGDDTRLGEALDNTSDLPGGETYAFDAIGALMSDKAEQVESYTLEIGDGM